MSDEELKITDIPGPLHHLQWSDFPEGFETDGAVRMLQDAHSRAESAWKATLTGHRKVMADPTNTPDRNMQRSHEAATRRAKEVEKEYHRAIQATGAELEALDTAMNRVPNVPGPHIITMIADRMAQMDENARRKRIIEAIETDDHWTVAAALFNGSPWLYGLTQTKRDLFLTEYRAKKFPEHMARKAAIEKAQGILTKGFEAFQRANSKLYDEERLEKAQKLADEAKRALGG